MAAIQNGATAGNLTAESDGVRHPAALIYPLWILFCAVLIVVAVRDYYRGGGDRWWRPILWEGSSVVFATLLLAIQRTAGRRYDRWLSEPTKWFAHNLKWLVVAQSEDGIAAAEAIARHTPDVAFLDIQMAGLTGLEVAAQLEQRDAPLLVFVTAFDAHAIRAFELSAIDYLLKPFDKDRLLLTLARVRERARDRVARASAVATARAQTRSSERLLVPDGGQLHLIDISTVEWIEAADNYVHVHTPSRSYLLRRTLRDLLSQLGEHQFARIHKSAAVNLAAIRALAPLFKGDHDVRLRSGKTLRLSRRYKDALFACMQR
jgi:two-component system LytT family response regulator